MKAPDRIWIDAWGGNWSPRVGGTQEHEYVRLDPAVLAALPEVRAMIRQAMAAWQKAYEEPDRDTEPKEEADRISALWFAHWMKLNHPTASEHDDHHGDCTGHNISCLRCISDDVLASVDAALVAAILALKRGGE